MKKYVYIVIELGSEQPKIKGVFWNEKDAEKEAYKNSKAWCNIRKEEVR